MNTFDLTNERDNAMLSSTPDDTRGAQRAHSSLTEAERDTVDQRGQLGREQTSAALRDRSRAAKLLKYGLLFAGFMARRQPLLAAGLALASTLLREKQAGSKRSV